MPKRNMHPEDVKAAVRKTGVTLSGLARDNGFSDSAGRKALYQPIPRVNRLIAKRLGKTVHEIWPEWFDSQGYRVTNGRKDSPARRSMPSQKEEAA